MVIALSALRIEQISRKICDMHRNHITGVYTAPGSMECLNSKPFWRRRTQLHEAITFRNSVEEDDCEDFKNSVFILLLTERHQTNVFIPHCFLERYTVTVHCVQNFQAPSIFPLLIFEAKQQPSQRSFHCCRQLALNYSNISQRVIIIWNLAWSHATCNCGKHLSRLSQAEGNAWILHSSAMDTLYVTRW